VNINFLTKVYIRMSQRSYFNLINFSSRGASKKETMNAGTPKLPEKILPPTSREKIIAITLNTPTTRTVTKKAYLARKKKVIFPKYRLGLP